MTFQGLHPACKPLQIPLQAPWQIRNAVRKEGEKRIQEKNSLTWKYTYFFCVNLKKIRLQIVKFWLDWFYKLNRGDFISLSLTYLWMCFVYFCLCIHSMCMSTIYLFIILLFIKIFTSQVCTHEDAAAVDGNTRFRRETRVFCCRWDCQMPAAWRVMIFFKFFDGYLMEFEMSLVLWECWFRGVLQSNS